jgi:hypothetical protein
LLQELTLDVIGEAAFGIEINAQKGGQSLLLSCLRSSLAQNITVLDPLGEKWAQNIMHVKF